MPRKRMIDPSIWQDEGMAELTPRQQLLYIGLFSNADDDGRIRGSASAIRLVLPTVYGGLGLPEVEADLLAMLAAMRRVLAYEHEGRRYLVFLNYHRWQKIDHPYPSTLPPPPEPTVNGQEPFAERSANEYRMLPEHSRESPPSIKEEKIVKDNPPGGRARATAAAAAPPSRQSTKSSSASLAPLVDAFRAVGLPDPVFLRGEATDAAALRAQYPDAEIAACWADHASGAYGGPLDQQKLSFGWLIRGSPLANWQRWKAHPPAPTRLHGSKRPPGGRQEFTTAQLVISSRRAGITVPEVDISPALAVEIARLEASGWTA